MQVYSFFDVKAIKRTLLVLIFFAGFFLLVNPLYLLERSPKSTDLAAEPRAELSSTFLDSLSSYESVFEQSSLFGTYGDKTKLPILKSSMSELTKDFRLKGVVVIDEPEAILMDARSDQSLFVREGDKVGELMVERIGDGMVVLSYFGEEKELRVQ